MLLSSEDKGSVVPVKQNSVCYTNYFRSFILFHKLAVLAHLLQEYCVFSICPVDSNIIHQHPFPMSQLWSQFSKTFKTCLNPREAENKIHMMHNYRLKFKWHALFFATKNQELKE